jgi:CO/xanthine dehydrogenase FAD-binding subunit
MNFRLAAPAVLIDLNAIETLSTLAAGEGSVRIGAMTRHQSLERSGMVARMAPLVSAAMPFVAHAAIRTRGTIGGSLAHADPAAELPAVMLALDATFTVTSSQNARRIRASDFFTGLFATALDVGELLTEIEVPPLPARSGVAFQEFSRRHGDFALAGAAAVVTCDEAGRCRTARVALLSVGDRPVMPAVIERTLQGEVPSPDAVRAAASAAAAEIDPPGDIHASSRYRRHLAAVLTRRVLESAFQAVRV